MGKIKRTEHKKKREYTRENMPKGLVFLILANIFFCIIFFSRKEKIYSRVKLHIGH